MSTTPRSLAEIQQEYQNVAFKAGNLQYAITQQTQDLKLLNDTMRDLNLEFVAAKEAADKAAAETAAEPAPAAPEATSDLVAS